MPTYLVQQIFVVDPKSAAQYKERLIEAANKGAAIRKVADETISAEIATTDDVIRLTKAGAELERAE